MSWVLPEIIAGKVKRSSDSSRLRDRGSLNLIAVLWTIGIIAGFLLSLYVPQTALAYRQTELFYLGICLLLAGLALRWYSVAVLGEYFTFDVAVHLGQPLIDVGPYRYVRHPSYSGALLSLLGFGLALGNWAALFVSLSCLGLAYAYRIPVEEAALTAGLGEPYTQYVSRTWRLVPFLF
ncbi:MAG: protein-S-isoprenylcysteine methyltransferase [Acidobacteriaceae bacterium]|nr:protein-S-isoprenylcysteine methyltransferase [Acidobacteriaceae bacterium]